MGLDTTHNAWHGPYSSFNQWRTEIAKHSGITLSEMIGFRGVNSWDKFKDHPLYPLLNHSDCDGEIAWQDCKKIYKELRRILSLNVIEPFFVRDTEQFANGCRDAFNKKENIQFH